MIRSGNACLLEFGDEVCSTWSDMNVMIPPAWCQLLMRLIWSERPKHLHPCRNQGGDRNENRNSVLKNDEHVETGSTYVVGQFRLKLLTGKWLVSRTFLRVLALYRYSSPLYVPRYIVGATHVLNSGMFSLALFSVDQINWLQTLKFDIRIVCFILGLYSGERHTSISSIHKICTLSMFHKHENRSFKLRY